MALDKAVSTTVAALRNVRAIEPRFTRQLAASLEVARDEMPGSTRYDITHQPELPIVNAEGVVVAHRRLDIRILFRRQLGRAGDYLAIECKYLDTTDRATDADYVDEGVERIVQGAYAANHPWAIMVGLERVGPISISISHVDERLHARYGPAAQLQNPSCVGLDNVRDSKHLQVGGAHRITILHAFFFVAGA